MAHRLYYFGILFLLFFNCKSHKEDKALVVNPYAKRITILGDSLLQDAKINALSIGVYKNGEKMSFHFGELDPGQNNKPTDTIIYEIASVSKVLTGTLVAKSVLDKKIALDTALNRFLDEDFSNFKYADSPVTIRHLLTHTSGLPKFYQNLLIRCLQSLTKVFPLEWIVHYSYILRMHF